jgi:imidazolonepropionase-like amidohydrolase
VIPPEAVRLDARGKYLIPGLMDANVHLFINIDPESLIRYDGRYHEVILEGAQIALKSGLTTVFDTWGPRASLVKVRDMINKGQAVGSRIFLAGNIIGFSGPLGEDFMGHPVKLGQAVSQIFSKSTFSRINETWEQTTGRELLWMTPEELRPVIRAYAKSGVDFLKYAAGEHFPGSYITFSPPAQRVIVEEAHRAGMIVQAHTMSVPVLDLAIESGLDIITHGDLSGPTPIPDATIRKLVERKIPVSILPVTERSIEAQEKRRSTSAPGTSPRTVQTNERNIIKAGVRVLLSTDAGIQPPLDPMDLIVAVGDTIDPLGKLGEGHFNALVALEDLGMDRMEILRAATSNIAAAYKRPELGTLEPGKVADLVILDANPLESARNYRRINAVIKDGKVVDLGSLPVAPLISVKPPSR